MVNKAGDAGLQEVALTELKRLLESQDQMTALTNPVVKESSLPLQILFNDKFERIRVAEYETETAPKPIKYEIYDCFSGVPSRKIVKITSESAPKAYTVKVDLNHKKNPKIFETKFEALTRASRLKKSTE